MNVVGARKDEEVTTSLERKKLDTLSHTIITLFINLFQLLYRPGLKSRRCRVVFFELIK